MTGSAKKILDSFEDLPETEKREVASAILRRALQLETAPLTDEDLVAQADELFRDLDSREAADE